jgi:hypothetical protein
VLVFELRVLTQNPDTVILARHVAAASGLLRAFPVNDCEHAPVIADQITLAQRPGCTCDAGAAHAEHMGRKFVSDGRLFAVRPISRHQQPTREPRLHKVKSSAGSVFLRPLGECYLEKAVKDLPQRQTAFDLIDERARLHFQGRPCSLHQCAHWRYRNVQRR